MGRCHGPSPPYLTLPVCTSITTYVHGSESKSKQGGEGFQRHLENIGSLNILKLRFIVVFFILKVQMLLTHTPNHDKTSKLLMEKYQFRNNL